MQRQDDFQIDRSNMLLFIAQLVSLAGLIIRIVAAGRPVDDRLLHAFIRCETAMLIVLGGVLGNTDMRGLTPGLDDEILFDEPDDRHAELLRIAATLQQIATTLALILSMFPRAFRDRHRASSFRGGKFPPPCGGPKDGRDPWLAPAGGRRSLPGGVTRGSVGANSGLTQRRGSHGGGYPTPGLRPDPPRKGEGAVAARAPP